MSWSSFFKPLREVFRGPRSSAIVSGRTAPPSTRTLQAPAVIACRTREEPAHARALRSALIERAPTERAIHNKIEALIKASTDPRLTPALIRAQHKEIQAHFSYEDAAFDADMALAIAASLETQAQVVSPLLEVDHEAQFELDMAAAIAASLDTQSQVVPPEASVSQQTQPLVDRLCNEAKQPVFHLRNVNSQSLIDGLAHTHKEKGISGAGCNCAWRSAWTAVMLKMQPEKLKEVVADMLGQERHRDAEQMAHACIQGNSDILSIFEGKTLNEDSRLQLPGSERENGEVLLNELAGKLLQKGGASADDVRKLVYEDKYAGAEDLMKFFKPLGISVAILETKLAAGGEQLATLTVCSGDDVHHPDSAGPDNIEGRTAEIQELLKDMPVLRIKDSHVTVHIPNQSFTAH